MEEQSTTRRKPLLIGVLVGVLALLMALVVVLSPSNASALASVEVLEERVSARTMSGGSFRPLSSSTSFSEGAAFRTDRTGMAAIEYFDGSLTRIGPETEYELVTLEDGDDRAIVGELEIGRTFHRVAELSGSRDRFEVRTANAVAAVRGTEFLVICEQRGVCEIGVVEGVVEAVSRTTGERILLSAGQELTVSADGSLSEVRPLDLTDAWLILNFELDDVDLDDLRVRLFGPDEEPGTDDDPPPPPVNNFAGDDSASGSEAPRGGPDSPSGNQGEGRGNDGAGSPGQGSTTTQATVLGETEERPTTSTTRGGNTSTTRPGNTPTTGPGNTPTTRPGNTTTTRPQGTTSTTNPCQPGYPPRPC